MTLLARTGPEGSLLLDLGDAGLYQIRQRHLHGLITHGDLALLYPTEFSDEPPDVPAGYAMISAGREAAYITHRRTGRRFACPLAWLCTAAETRQPTELKEITT